MTQKTGQTTSESSTKDVMRCNSTNTVRLSRHLRGIEVQGLLDFKAFKAGVAKAIKQWIGDKFSKKRGKKVNIELFRNNANYFSNQELVETSRKKGFLKRLSCKRKNRKPVKTPHDNHLASLAASFLILLTSISILVYGIVKVRALTTFKLTLVFLLFTSGFVLACCLFFHRKKTMNKAKAQLAETTQEVRLKSLRTNLQTIKQNQCSPEDQELLKELRDFSLDSLRRKTDKKLRQLILYICDELWQEDRGILIYKLMQIALSEESKKPGPLILDAIATPMLYDCFGDNNYLLKYLNYLCGKEFTTDELTICQQYAQIPDVNAFKLKVRELRENTLQTFADLHANNNQALPQLLSEIFQTETITEHQASSLLVQKRHSTTTPLLFHLLQDHLNFGAKKIESTLTKQIKQVLNTRKKKPNKKQIEATIKILSSIKEQKPDSAPPNARSLIFKYRYDPQHTLGKGSKRQPQHKPTSSASKKYVRRIKDALFSYWEIEQTSPEKLPPCIASKAIQLMKSDELYDDRSIKNLAIKIAYEVIHREPEMPTSNT